MSLFTFSPPPMLRRPLPLYQAGIAWFSSTLLSAIFIYILPVGKVQRRHNVYRSWMKGLPEQDEPLGGQKAKPAHQGEHHGQPEPVLSEYRQGLEPVLNISSPRHPHLQFSHSELSR